MKNKHIKITYLIVAICFIIGCGICFKLNVISGIIATIMALIIVITFTIYFYLKKKEIIEMSNYLTALVNGCNDLKEDCNEEGELSYLSNNIYKTAKRLKLQSELLIKDKKWLSDSLADVSHQLKTPITSMMVMTDLLMNDDIDLSLKKQFLNNINMELEKMQWLITTLLKLSKFDAGTTKLNHESFSLDKLVDSAVTPFLIQAEIREISIDISKNGGECCGDFNWSVEALTNIIKNCLEHTDTNGTLKIQTKQTSVYSQITIEDNGCGIEKDDLPHIFERFYKGKNSSQNSVGIGLALSKSVFDREGGIIDVKSEIGVGTKFTIKFYDAII